MFLTTLLSILLASGLCFAADSEIANSAHSSTWSGDALVRALTYFEPISSDVNNQLYQSDIHLEDETKFNSNLKFLGKIDFAADPFSKSSEERTFLDLPEFNLKWRVNDLIFKIGTDIYNWGVTDGINPVDVVNTNNYFDPIHPKKLGAAGLSISGVFSWFEFDAIYIPLARSPMLPGSHSRWLPREIYDSSTSVQPIEYILPDTFEYRLVEESEFNNAKQNNAALRLQAHLEDLDLALYGYSGVAAMPIINPIISGNLVEAFPVKVLQVNSGVELDLHDYRVLTGGASFVKTLNSWQLKGQSVWSQPSKDATLSKGFITTSVFAIEKNWATDSDLSLVTILQYSTSQQGGLSSNGLDSLSHFFDSNWMLGGHLGWRDRDTFTYFYSQDILQQAWLTDFRYERVLRDNLTLGANVNLLGGPRSSPLGVYSKNKSASVDLKLNF